MRSPAKFTLNKPRSRFSSKNKALLVIAFFVTAVAILALVLWNNSRRTVSQIPSTSPNSPGSSQPAEGGSNQQTPSQPSAGNQTAPKASDKFSPDTSSTELLAPSGSFVSNHKPNLDGEPAPSQVESVCNTAPGATCYIEFVKGSTVKKLESRVANSQGAVFWIWDVKEAGLSEGSWQITAYATLNGQTKSTKDSLTLDVSP